MALIATLLCACSDPAPPPRYPPQPPPGYSGGTLPPTIGDAFTALGLPVPALPPGTPAWPPPGTPWAAPPAPGGQDSWPAAWSAHEDQVLWLTNDIRTRGTVCGGQPMPPVAPLSPHPALRAAARGHCRDMATLGFGGHISPDGRNPADRMWAAGYPGQTLGENVGAGHDMPRDAVNGWLSSPEHCKNLMSPSYRFLGVGFFYSSNSSYREYWTQDFGG